MNDRTDVDHSRILNHVLAPPAGKFDFEAVQGTIILADELTQSRMETASITTLNPIRPDIAITIDAEATPSLQGTPR